MPTATHHRVLVTGGGGFLGGAIISRLIERKINVRCMARGAYPDLEKRGVEVIRGDIADAKAVLNAVQGCSEVFHVAAKAGISGRYDDYYRANVRGTENVIAACREAGVQKLLFTSSPSVIFDNRDMNGVDESVPYPPHFHAAYPQTKALAEQAVLAANGSSLATLALRPHLIWGPGDNHLVPRIIAKARRLRRIGGVNPLVDSTYIANAADAHLSAMDHLAVNANAAGRAYFISNGEPWPIWDLVGAILAAADLPPITRSLPVGVARLTAGACEALFRTMRLRCEPPLTRFLLHQLTTAHWFDIGAARRELGYEPKMTIREGLVELRRWLAANAGRR